MESVKELRHMGYKVKVQYQRWRGNPVGGEAVLLPYSPRVGFLVEVPVSAESTADKLVALGKQWVLPHGGTCEVEVMAPDGCIFKGTSQCSILDNFDRRRGLTIALGRALKLEELKHAL